MNYLAHCALSERDEQLMVGNFIADHVKGPIHSELPKTIAQGVKMHRMVDREFDHHPLIVAIRAMFPQGLRRYAGIVIDCWFDHILARDWCHFYPVSITEMQTKTELRLQRYHYCIPPSQHSFVNYFFNEKLFLQYQCKDKVIDNIKLMSNRLKRSAGLMHTLDFLIDNSLGIDEVFSPVFHYMQKICRECCYHQS